MIRHFFKIALRNLMKYKGFSFINIFGLTLGAACCLLILMFVRDETSFDRYHRNGRRVYRIASHSTIGGVTRTFALSTAALAPAVKEALPEVETYARVFRMGNAQFSYEGKNYDIPEFYLAEEGFFRIFSHEIVSGDTTRALEKPNSLVLTESAALELFGKTEAAGKTITVQAGPQKIDLLVAAVIRDVPRNSHFRPNMLLSTATFRQPAAPGANRPAQRSFLDEFYSFGCYSYLLLKPGTDPSVLEGKIKEVAETRWGDFLRARGVVRRYELQNLLDIHLRSAYEGELGAPGNSVYVTLFEIIALLVLSIACFNFVNLSTARSTLRAKEVGLRKVFGAARRQLVRQFLGESVLLSLFGVVLALFLVWLVLPAFNVLARKEFTPADVLSPAVLAGLLGIVLLIGGVSGSFPAFALSSFKAVETIRGKFGSGLKGRTLRKVLVVFQFSIAVFMIIGTTVVLGQLDYLKTKPLGFDRDMIIVMPRRGPQNEAFKNKLLQNPNILAASFDVSIPGQFIGDETYVPEGSAQDDTIRTSSFAVSHDFLKTYGIEVLWGRDFSKEFPSDAREGLIINETAARELGWGEAAVGKEMLELDVQGNTKYRIIGVVRDFHHKSLRTAINPTVLKLNPQFGQYISARLKPGSFQAALDHLKTVWREFVPQLEFSYYFMDDDFRNKYPNEERVRSIYVYFGILAIVVACLGLFGLASFIIERRTKEIGIRKTLGAGSRRIVYSLSSEFIGCVLLANLIAWPLAFWIMNNWLGTFAYRIAIGWWVFGLTAVMSLAIAALTVSYQSVKSARGNPAEALRYE